MSFQRRIKFYLVHTLKMSNKVAQELINNGEVEIDGTPVSDNCLITNQSEIKVQGKLERARTEFNYLKFYKPKGFESTLNGGIADNLSPFFSQYKNLAIAGRLDKQSEGLLLLSNDGKWVEDICNPKFEKEKEYIVTLEKNVNDEFINAFKNGVAIGTYTTKNCHCEGIGNKLIKVILSEGKNRQIRRMSKALGNTVCELKRVRIAGYHLEDLKPGELKELNVQTNEV